MKITKDVKLEALDIAIEELEVHGIYEDSQKWVIDALKEITKKIEKE